MSSLDCFRHSLQITYCSWLAPSGDSHMLSQNGQIITNAIDLLHHCCYCSCYLNLTVPSHHVGLHLSPTPHLRCQIRQGAIDICHNCTGKWDNSFTRAEFQANILYSPSIIQPRTSWLSYSLAKMCLSLIMFGKGEHYYRC